MSGIEVAGLALGALPVCAEALLQMQKTLTVAEIFVKWRYKVNNYVDQINGARLHLLLTLKKLCRSVDRDLNVDRITAGRIYELFQDGDLVDRIAAAHGSAYEAIVKDASAICDNVAELYSKLGLGKVSEATFLQSGLEIIPVGPNANFYKPAIGARLKFCISREEVKHLLGEIRQIQYTMDSKVAMSVSFLEDTLLDQRKAHIVRQLHAQANALHEAIASRLQCIGHEHSVMLLLESRKRKFEEGISRKAGDPDAFRLRVAAVPSDSYHCIEVQMTSKANADGSNTAKTLRPEVTNLCPIDKQRQPKTVPWICTHLDDEDLTKLRKSDSASPWSTGEPGQRGVASRELIPLSVLLKRRSSTNPLPCGMDSRQRRAFCVLLSVNALQLFSTAWLRCGWGKDDISVAWDGVVDPSSEQDFLLLMHSCGKTHCLESSAANQSPQASTPLCDKQRTRSGLFMLAVMLMELIFGEALVVHPVTSSGRPDQSIDFNVLAALQQWREDKRADMHKAYRLAVGTCISFALNPEVDFNEDEWVERAFADIVLPLQNEYQGWL